MLLLYHTNWRFKQFYLQVAFPNLQTLHIYSIHVEKIWHNLPPKISSCVQNLLELRISNCGNLKELFSSPTVVMDESREEEMRDTILFPKLNRLEIENLEKLTTLWSGYHIEFPTLKEFTIYCCSQLDEFIFDDKVHILPYIFSLFTFFLVFLLYKLCDLLKFTLHLPHLVGPDFLFLYFLDIYFPIIFGYN